MIGSFKKVLDIKIKIFNFGMDAGFIINPTTHFESSQQEPSNPPQCWLKPIALCDKIWITFFCFSGPGIQLHFDQILWPLVCHTTNVVLSAYFPDLGLYSWICSPQDQTWIWFLCFYVVCDLYEGQSCWERHVIFHLWWTGPDIKLCMKMDL